MTLIADWRAIRDQEIPRLYAEGDSIRRIARTYEITPGRVRQILRASGAIGPARAKPERDDAGLLPAQRLVLEAFGQLESTLGRPPFLRELGSLCGLRESTVLTYLKSLAEEHQMVEHRTDGSRCWWCMTTRGREHLGISCPHCGRATADTAA